MQHDQRGGGIKKSQPCHEKPDFKVDFTCLVIYKILIRVIVTSLSSLVDIFSGITMFITVYAYKSIYSRR